MATCMRRMRNNNLEIRIVGSSCHLQNLSGTKVICVGNATWCWHLFLTGLLIEINVNFTRIKIVQVKF